MTLWQRFKQKWMVFVDAFMKFQTFVFLSIVYHVTVGPIALGCRVFRKHLMEVSPSHRSGQASYADELSPITTSMERAHKQF